MPYNSAVDSFRTKQLCSRLSPRCRAKTGKKRSLCVFRPPLEAGYDVHVRLIGKQVVDFLLMITELFSLAVMLLELRANIDWKAPF